MSTLNKLNDTYCCMYRIKSKLLLLKLLHDHVKLSLENSKVNPNSQSDMVDMVLAMKDKKTLRELKLIEKELKKWIKEWKNEI